MRYAVFGNPIAHSRSPMIHSYFAQLYQQALTYEALLAPIDGFAATVKAFFAEGGQGCNVTVPFKVEALNLAEVVLPRAAACGAANTLWMQDGRLHADNTDGAGLVRDLIANLNIPLDKQRVLLLGAGGAARGAVLPLLEAGVESITIANRTYSKAKSVVAQFHKKLARPSSNDLRQMSTPNLKARRFEDLANRRYNIVINATAAGLEDQSLNLPDNVIRNDGVGYDMVYGKNTMFMAWAAAHGAKVHDGLGMLVEQAAEAFSIWRGFRPSTRETMALLRASINAEASGLVKKGEYVHVIAHTNAIENSGPATV
jgi:shikimate dehydrogenase